MYTALGIMLAGMFLGRILRAHISLSLIRKSIMAAIFLLLFLLGVSIGGNQALLERLPHLGWQALLLMGFCVAGSIVCCLLLEPFFGPGRASPKTKPY